MRKQPEARFLRACRRLPVDRTPVWFMRQAGRYMAEYRQLRTRYSLLELCREPELAAQVTLQPVERLEVDAAILFADILLPLIPMGLDLEFVKGKGPVIHNPLQTASHVRDLRPVVVEEQLGNVLAAIRLLRRELPPTIPLIGFAGAPFTLACYMIEGGSSRHYLQAKSMMLRQPQTWHRLMEHLTQMLIDYLTAQVRAGAQAVQLFDSWVGALSPSDYRAFAKPYSSRILHAITDLGVPTIHFGTGTAALLEEMRAAGGSVIGVDWRVELDKAWTRIGHDVAIQGNLDPAALFAPEEVLAERVRAIMAQAAGRPGHVFNLGHGVLPQTDVAAVRQVVELVHRHRHEHDPKVQT